MVAEDPLTDTEGVPPDPLTEWERRWAETPERDVAFTTLSGVEVPPLVGPHNSTSVFANIGYPGVYPFTRGVYPSMYRGRPWT
ncbi:MAG: methylmalonyl-CoA mutase family protein, partial [Pseudonocardiaceae bacterium]